MAQMVAMLQDAGLIEVFVDDDGRGAYRLTDNGVCLGHMLAIAREAHAHAVLEALLGSDVPA